MSRVVGVEGEKKRSVQWLSKKHQSNGAFYL